MKKYSQSLVILPCHSLEDFPLHFRGQDAENLLACWTVGWHPALIHSTAQTPRWRRADESTQLPPHALVIIPTISRHILDVRFEEEAAQQSVTLITDDADRATLLDQCIAASDYAQEAQKQISSELAPDFLALGYAYLQIQIMTRQLRYSSQLEEEEFQTLLVQAANEACDGKDERARATLTTCFDLLLQERNAYYPVDPDFIDLVLTAPTTLGPSLTRQLARSHVMNLLISGTDAQTLESQNQSAVTRLRTRLASQQLSLVGGLENEIPTPLLSSESTIAELKRGRKTYQRLFGSHPTIFARRTFGLTPSLPGLLEQMGFVGALHVTFDQGSFPQGTGPNLQWSGNNDQSIPALGVIPIDANSPDSFLGLGVKIGEQIDSAHVATLLFAHWPDQTCDAFDDLIRISQYGPLLGNFVRLEDYFENVCDPGYPDMFTADEYRSPYLQQAITQSHPDPISRMVNYWNAHVGLAQCRALLVQLNLMPPYSSSDHLDQIESLERMLDASVASAQASREKALSLSDQIAELQQQILQAWQRGLGEPVAAAASPIEHPSPRNHQHDSHSPGHPFLLWNPSNARRRITFQSEVPEPIHWKTTGAIRLVDSVKQTSGTPRSETSRVDGVVEAPGSGWVTVDLSTPPPESSRDPFRSDPPVLDQMKLQNEFFELKIDPQTGGIRGIQEHRNRRNLVSQQLALRIPGTSPHPNHPTLKPARYSTMVADSIEGSRHSRIRAQMVSRGRLMDDQQVVATFEQTITVTRGIPIADLEIRLTPQIELTPSIHHYFCNRLAWKDESGSVYANDQETRAFVASDWFLATQFIDVEQPEQQTTLLTGGLPYHRRVTRRMIDSPLIIGRESQRAFRLGIGVGIRYSMMTALQWMAPPVRIERDGVDAKKWGTGWLFHFDCRNLLVTCWQPTWHLDGTLAGVLIRMRETEGRSGKLTLRCPRPIESAERTTFSGKPLEPISVSSAPPHQVVTEFHAFDHFQLSLHWKS